VEAPESADSTRLLRAHVVTANYGFRGCRPSDVSGRLKSRSPHRRHWERMPMVSIAVRATSHVAAWIVWQSMRVSLLDDLPVPAPPHEERQAA
jgi:hypothetical protein